MPNGTGWDRWRGETDATAAQHEEELRKLWDWKDVIEQRLSGAMGDIRVLNAKVAIAAALGSLAGGAILAAVQRLFQ